MVWNDPGSDPGGGGTFQTPGGKDDGNKNYFYETRSRVFVVKYIDGEKKGNGVSENDFLDLFYGGEFKSLEPDIRGYKPEGKGAYKVTFYAISENVENMEAKLIGHESVCFTANKVQVSVRFFRPREPVKKVVLRPVPIEYDLQKLKEALQPLGWGTPKSIERGLHRKVGNRRRLENEYVYLKYASSDLKENKLPVAISLQGHYVYVTKPNESVKVQCSYCLGFWHTPETCYKKKRDEAEKLAIEEPCTFCEVKGHHESSCMEKIMHLENEKSLRDKTNQNQPARETPSGAEEKEWSAR